MTGFTKDRIYSLVKDGATVIFTKKNGEKREAHLSVLPLDKRAKSAKEAESVVTLWNADKAMKTGDGFVSVIIANVQQIADQTA